MTMMAGQLSGVMDGSPVDAAQRIEELGRVIMAYSEVTERLQTSHERLEKTVSALRVELGEKNRQLERRNRLAALGEMAAGMAHEIRNPLGGIQLYASLLSKDLLDRPDSLSIVKKISSGVKRLESLVSQVLSFSREIKANTTTMDLRNVVDQSIELTSAVLREQCIECVVDGPESLMVKADSLLLGQALLNLLLNAAEAIESNGTIGIALEKLAEGDAHQFRLCVRDSGPGIAADVIDRIFNPFFTTRDAGTGLGLAIVHRIVEAHDGSIRVFNGETGGAVFEIVI